MLTLRIERDSDELSVQPCQVFGIAEHFSIAGNLFIGKTVKALAPAVTYKSGAENEIDHNAVLVFYASVWQHTVDLSLVVADNTHLFLKGVKGFNQSADGFLHTLQRSVNLNRMSQFGGLQ